MMSEFIRRMRYSGTAWQIYQADVPDAVNLLVIP